MYIHSLNRFPGNKSGYFTFTGKRLGLVCQQMHTLALNALSLADKNKIYKEVSYIPCAGKILSHLLLTKFPYFLREITLYVS